MPNAECQMPNLELRSAVTGNSGPLRKQETRKERNQEEDRIYPNPWNQATDLAPASALLASRLPGFLLNPAKRSASYLRPPSCLTRSISQLGALVFSRFVL